MKQSLILIDPTLNPGHPLIQALSCILGPGQILNIVEGKNPEGYEPVVICAPSEARAAVTAYLKQHRDWLYDHPAGLLALGEEEEGSVWLSVAQELLGGSALQITRIPADAPVNAAIDFALALRAIATRSADELAPEQLKVSVEAFLKEHNTCSLATVYQGELRNTPLEYQYEDGHIYCVSEGGVKFAGLLQNGEVSLTIYDPYRGFDNLAGMQLSGYASVPPLGSPDYIEALSMRGLTWQKAQSLPVVLHIIDITLDEAIFLWSGFKKIGAEMRQVYRFGRWETDFAARNSLLDV